ncbi:alpha-glucuronidase, partial [candidate division KSB1 bacterium]|nr:alpha-glucuronidase [candidate division KSB1 bacterium]
MKKFRILLQILVLASFASAAHSAEDGYRLWLKYDKISDARVLASYENILQNRFVVGQSATINVIKKELDMAFSGLLGKPLSPVDEPGKSTLVIAKTDELPSGIVLEKGIKDQLTRDGYFIKTQRENNDSSILITAKDDTGLLYGTFHFLRLLQTHADITALHMLSNPKIDLRVLNHWDNLDRTVERGYAGFSLWDWQKLPDYLHPYYHDYARANASIGLNGTVLNNVNANAWILQPLYLKKVAALADAFRPYGIRVYLSIRFSSPIDIGGLPVSDPLDKDVQKWWQDKVKEIYQYVPDFGGFLVKANSEGQPGPGDYGRSHADGANMLADALKPYNGVVMWRAFVYDTNNKDDRAKQAYSEFKPLDGTFRDNVLVQVKNGPIDFQPREPFHPMFGGMPSTPLMMEFQITKEYLGFATHNVYLAPLFEEVLRADTYAQGKGSTVAKVIDGSLDGHKISGIAGVANTGTDRNWTGT